MRENRTYGLMRGGSVLSRSSYSTNCIGGQGRALSFETQGEWKRDKFPLEPLVLGLTPGPLRLRCDELKVSHSPYPAFFIAPHASARGTIKFAY